ncbi:hypothetical protein [Roseococcus sp. DSY-14]|uniref:hypothetical protein n=1 Tax=Roseococcus sp. DSY-14 TaxID=3369650 RepID=UPI00387B67A7
MRPLILGAAALGLLAPWAAPAAQAQDLGTIIQQIAPGLVPQPQADDRNRNGVPDWEENRRRVDQNRNGVDDREERRAYGRDRDRDGIPDRAERRAYREDERRLAERERELERERRQLERERRDLDRRW